jgi:hypothetical protein
MTNTDTTELAPADAVVTTVDTYLAAFNEPDAAVRRTLVGRAFADDARYLDPLLEGNGIDGITEMMGAVHANYPGYRFRRTSGVDVHHDLARFAWELVDGDGGVFVAGIDVVVVAGDRLSRIAGFFGDLPAA